MNVSRPFIQRPVATGLFMLAIVLVGLLGWRFLPRGNTITQILVAYAVYSLICKWIVSWGGAEFLKGRCLSWLFNFGQEDSTETIRNWTKLSWLGISVLLVLILLVHFF